MAAPGFFANITPPACGPPPESQPPSIQELEAFSQPRRGRRGTRDCPTPWVCPNCPRGAVYQPTRGLLVDLPHFQCGQCGRKNKTIYDWRITKTRINGVRLDFMIYDQGCTRHCAMYAFIAALDAARRIWGAIDHRCITAAPFDIRDFLRSYRIFTGWEPGLEPKAYLCSGFDNIPYVLYTAMNQGVSYRLGIYDEPIPRLRIRGFFRVRHSDVEIMTRLIANGFPLVGGVKTGRLFQYVQGGEVYAAPITSGASYHAVAFIGSALGVNSSVRDGSSPLSKKKRDGSPLGSEDNLQTYFIARDSGGSRAHGSYELEGMGGDFNVWACDVMSAWGFFL